MQLTILGSNGTYPTAGRPASGYLVSHDSTRLWLDAGPGTFAALVTEMDSQDLTGVLLSHRHPDHCADIFALFHALAYGPESHPPLPVIVPEGLADRLCSFVEGSADRMRAVFDFWTVAEGDVVTLGDLELAVTMANHPPPTIAPRITGGGKTLAYTADTGPSESLQRHALGCDLLLAEATLAAQDRSDAIHLTGTQAGAMAARAEARRLMLTHIAPYVDPGQSVVQAEAAFDGPVSLAVPGARVTV